MTNEVWDVAVFLGEWDGREHYGTPLRYKLFTVPREAIDEGSEEPDALLLVGLNSGAVRCVDVTIDTAYSRTITDADMRAICWALAGAPDEFADRLCDASGWTFAAAAAERSLHEDYCADCGMWSLELYQVESRDGDRQRVCPTCATMYGIDEDDE